MKQYELLVVYKPNTDAEEIDKLVAKLLCTNQTQMQKKLIN